ncbi:Starch-binding associating with outer membrane [Catalinimonas alkaloidigena]|uniref:Starch-binding associating with outer membrane n=1 Tax=Catalinimonas alkaloidigena TaxID=1075417 RepID=A0A1G9HRX6_9BACT|nr:RagB/SusD family nutrient uptake outer membrane protein [Catalinimonas alkaloidigena]SDL15566.1 Starch-binding associating with outer membrane [Catalinimonas alkaloidigena]
MKPLKHILITLLLIGVCACDADEWLEEQPLDFYTTQNSYNTVAQFRQALNFEYDLLREMYWRNGDQTVLMYFADLGFGGTDFPDAKFNNFQTFLTPTTFVSGSYWNRAYVGIANTNTILNRLDLADEIGEDSKQAIRGEARFFRAYWYTLLAHLFGGVPIVLEEEESPRRDYEQATREAVYAQARIDLEEAIRLLPNIEDVKDGMISKQAAQHQLAEVLLSLNDHAGAAAAATAVIDHPGMALMTTRFGTYANMPRDPYWDLFQHNNQNRSSGNTESILVLQYDYQNSGSTYSFDHPRFILPFYPNCRVADSNGELVNAFLSLTEDKGGRGIGVVHPSYHFREEIWGEDGTNDYRNAPYMIVRDFRIDNPAAAGFGEWIVEDGWLREADTLRMFYPFVMKFARNFDLPDEVYAKNADGSIQETALGEKVINYSFGSISANTSIKDEYLFRLAGTYLLRAEAYVRSGQNALALNDINALRTRANATPATLEEMNLDYILDEQLRELYFEDFRVVTLCRMGKLVERTKKYNPTGYNIGEHQNLWPIPYSEIERNVLGTIEQNPGYN